MRRTNSLVDVSKSSTTQNVPFTIALQFGIPMRCVRHVNRSAPFCPISSIKKISRLSALYILCLSTPKAQNICSGHLLGLGQFSSRG